MHSGFSVCLASSWLLMADSSMPDACAIPLGELPQRFQSFQPLGVAVFLAPPWEERISHLHHIPVLDV